MTYDQASSEAETRHASEKSLNQVTVVVGITAIVCFFFALLSAASGFFWSAMAGRPDFSRRSPSLMMFAQLNELITPQAMSIFMYLSAAAYIAAAGLLFIAANFCRQKRGYLYVISVCALCCLQLPFGTAVGVFCLYQLNKKPVKELFKTSKEA